MESFDRPIFSAGESFQSKLQFQMSAVAAMLLARKARASITDQPGLVLQSLSQLNEKSNTSQPQLVSNNSDKSIVANQSKNSLSNCEIFSTFGNSVSQSTLMMPFSKEHHTDINSPSYNYKDAPTEFLEKENFLTHFTQCSHASHLPNLIRSPHKESTNDTTKHLLSMQCDKSNHEHLQVTESSINKTSTSSTISDSQKSTDSYQSSANNFGFGILSRTRQFGAWLTKATEGSKLDITKKDLNTLAPNSF